MISALSSLRFFAVYVISFMSVLMGIEICTDRFFSEKLENTDQKAFLACQSIAQNKLFTKGKVEFFVSKQKYGRDDAYVYSHKSPFFMMFFRNKVFLSSGVLKGDIKVFLRTIVAHELGHIEYVTGDQIEADRFAALIVGKDEVLRWLSYEERNTPNIDIGAVKKRKEALVKTK